MDREDFAAMKVGFSDFKALVMQSEVGKMRMMGLSVATGHHVVNYVAHLEQAQASSAQRTDLDNGNSAATPSPAKVDLSGLTRYEPNFADGEEGMEVCALGDYYEVADVERLLATPSPSLPPLQGAAVPAEYFAGRVFVGSDGKREVILSPHGKGLRDMARLYAAPASAAAAPPLTDERAYELVAEHEIKGELFGHAVFDADGVLNLIRAVEREVRATLGASPSPKLPEGGEAGGEVLTEAEIISICEKEGLGPCMGMAVGRAIEAEVERRCRAPAVELKDAVAHLPRYRPSPNYNYGYGCGSTSNILFVADRTGEFVRLDDMEVTLQLRDEAQLVGKIDVLNHRQAAVTQICEALRRNRPYHEYKVVRQVVAQWAHELSEAHRCRAQRTNNEGDKPIDCSGDPSICPDNEGYGCHCGYGTATPAPAPAGGDAWISVDDRLPGNEVAVLVTNLAAKWERPTVAAYFAPEDGEDASWQDEHGEDLWPPVPTHWMPLPAAPFADVQAAISKTSGAGKGAQ